MALLVKICKILNDNLALIDFPSSTGAVTSVVASAVDVPAGVIRRDVPCNSGVNAGDPVIINSNGLAVQALATSFSNANFAGIAVTKETQTMCHVRFTGLVSSIYSNLINNSDYFIGTAGGIVDTPPLEAEPLH